MFSMKGQNKNMPKLWFLRWCLLKMNKRTKMGSDISLSISEPLGQESLKNLSRLLMSYLANYSEGSKDQMIWREVGAPVIPSPPLLKFGTDILIKKNFFFHVGKVVLEIRRSVLRISLIPIFRVAMISYLVASLVQYL